MSVAADRQAALRCFELKAGGIEALGDARAAIDQIGAALMTDDLRGAEPAGIDLRAAGAEEGQKHGVTLPIGRRQNKAGNV